MTEFKLEKEPTSFRTFRLVTFIIIVFVFWFFSCTGMVVCTLATILAYALVPYKNAFGSLEIADNQAILNVAEKSYPLKGEITFKYSSRRTWYRNHYDFGNNNELTLTNDKESVRCWVCVENKEQENALSKWLLVLHKSKDVNLIESCNGERSYGLKILTYQEIQDLKGEQK